MRFEMEPFLGSDTQLVHPIYPGESHCSGTHLSIVQPIHGSLRCAQTNVFGLDSGSNFGITCFPSASIPLMISSCLSWPNWT